MEQATIIGIDLAKSSLQLHGARADGSVAFRKKLSRAKLLDFVASQPRCVVAMEACASAHYWGRAFGKLGHEVKLIPPVYVKPFVKRQKNDAADAEAICEAASRPTMRFVAVKTREHRLRGAVRDDRSRWRDRRGHPDRDREDAGGAGSPRGREGASRLPAWLRGRQARTILRGKAAGDGEVVFDGNGNFALFNVMAADHTYFEGITFRNTEFAIWAGEQSIAGSKGLTVKHCRFENVGVGVFTSYSGSSNFYIADNWFYGRNDPDRLIGWSDAPLWGWFDGVAGQVHPPVMASYVAVKVYGPGHVVAHNYIADFRDGINVETYGNPDGSVAPHRERPTGPGTRPASTGTDVRSRSTSTTTTSPTPTTTRSRPTGACTTSVCGTCFINHPSHAF